MRKETQLGLFGGVAVVAAFLIVNGLHGKSKPHGVTTALMPDAGNGGAGDDSAGRATDEQTPVKPDEKPIKPQDAKPAPKADNVQYAKADPQKDKAIHNLLFGSGSTPLIGSSVTPDPKADNTATYNNANNGNNATDAITPAEHIPANNTGGVVVQPLAHDTASPTTQPKGQTTASGKGHTHTVQKGETFSTIAAAAYGSANFYPYIMRANPQIDAKALKPGAVIVLPDANEVKAPEKPTADAKEAPRTDATTAAHKIGVAALDTTKEYKVAPGDSLHRIAIKLYGKIDMVNKIYEANRAAIGDNPAALKVGMVLKLPQPPVSTATAAAH